MKKKFLLALALLFLIALGCKKNKESEPQPIVIGPISNHFVTADQANKIAITYSVYPRSVAIPSGKGPVINGYQIPKGNIAKTIKSTKLFSDNKIDPDFYIINYKEGGFAIIAGDDRAQPVLAFADTKDFNTDNPEKYPDGLKYWLERTTKMMKALRRKTEQSTLVKAAWNDIQMKSNFAAGKTETAMNYYYSGLPPCTVNGMIAAQTITSDTLIKTTWSQGDTFNNLLPFQSCYPNSNLSATNGRVLAGCVPVAYAQVMYFYKWPNNYNWSLMSLDQQTNDECARLLLMLGMYAYTDYGCSSSGTAMANPSAISNITNNFHYIYHDDPYQSSHVLTELYNGTPIILYGYPGSSVQGHAWVASGVISTDYYTCHIATPLPPVPDDIKSSKEKINYLPGGPGGPPHGTWENSYETDLKFYMNWGQAHGSYDGYYATGDFEMDGKLYDTDLRMITMYPTS